MCMHPKSFQSYLTLCDPMNCSPPGSSVHGILQARILEWVAMPSSSRSSWPRDWTCILVSPALVDVFFTTSATWEALQIHIVKQQSGLPWLLSSKKSSCNSGDGLQCRRCSFSPWLERSPGWGNGNPFQYSCLEKSHGQRSQVGCSPWGCKSQTWLSN